MTVLWILLGLLAALLLLLCCPVTLRLSWWPAAASKRDEPSGCLTEQVEQDLEQLGLDPEDEQQLRRLIQGLPDPPPRRQSRPSGIWRCRCRPNQSRRSPWRWG